MKRKDLLLLTSLLLAQTAPVWAMWNNEDERTIETASNGQPRVNVRHTGFVPSLPPVVNTLDLSDPLPVNWGIAKQRVSCTFGNNAPIEITLPTEYPLLGQWVFQEDRDNTQNLATLKLKALVGNQWKEVFQRQVNIQHELVQSDPEVAGWNYFNGDKVYQARTMRQRWKNPRTRQEYCRTLARQDNDVSGHQGSQVIYVEPFAFGGEPLKPKDAYRGAYHFTRDLADREGLPGKKVGSLLYSDGNNIYLPHVTQELWNKENSQAGFLIASYKQDRRLTFIPQAQLPNGQLPEGLYQLLSVQDSPNRRTERWQKLGEDQSIVEIMAPAGVSSIAGMGSAALHVVPQGQASAEVLELQNSIQEMSERVRRNAELHPNPTGSVFVLGPSRTGKSTLIHGLAGSSFIVQRTAMGMCLRPERMLDGFNIEHGGTVGTTIPTVWYDENHNITYWDCPGFGDSRGNKADIINAFSIDKILRNSNSKVLLVVEESNLNANGTAAFVKLLNDITNVFQSDEQLRQSLSLVVTKQDRTAVPERLREILQEAHTFSPRARNLLQFFVESSSSRVFSIPYPTSGAEYQFDRNGLLSCINSCNYVPLGNQSVNISVSDTAKAFAGDLAQNLNQYLTNYMKTEGSQRVINHCRRLIDDHQGSVGTLRATTLTNLIRALQALQQVPTGSPMLFADGLRNIINVDDIEKTIAHLGFLKTIKNDVVYQINDWSNALLETIQKIQNLIISPQPTYVNGVLNINGIVVGTSDLHAAIQRHPNPQNINISALNTVFIDQDVTSPGTSCSFIAPYWKIMGAHTINLSGNTGNSGNNGNPVPKAAGGNGQPGGPGGNGGHFDGKGFVFEGVTLNGQPRFTVNMNGGAGGKGGNGGKGADGINGINGNLNPLPAVGHDYPGTDGSPGLPGGQGGKGGTGGLGGQHGLTTVEGTSWKTEDGTGGENGALGVGGQGGIHGLHNIGIVNWGTRPESYTKSGGFFGTEIGYYDVPYSYMSYALGNARGSAPNGNPGQGLNTVGQQQPAPQVPLNPGPLVQAYNVYYQQQAANPTVAPFMKVFPNLQ